MELTPKVFSVNTFNLSMDDPNTGNRLQANYYTVPGINDDNGNPRPLSIGQLVMALCLDQAVQFEAAVVEMMSQMANTIVKMEVLTGIQEVIANNPNANGELYLEGHTYDLSAWPGATLSSTASWSETYQFLTDTKYGPDGKALCPGLSATSSAEEVISAVSSALDDLNTVNQEEMIELESLTNKRDQRYDLITNVLKSFNNVMTSIANNI